MRIIYGANPVMEALKSTRDNIFKVLLSSERNDRVSADILKAAAARDIPVERAAQKELDRVSGIAKHQGAVALISEEFKYCGIEELIDGWKKKGGRALFIILDSIQDPQNLGSIIRAAAAAGATGVVIPKDRACEITPAVVKASAGATEHVMVARETNLTRVIERLKDENVWVAAIEAGCEKAIYDADIKTDVALVVGSEGKGIRRLVRENCDYCVYIPMEGPLNSLNAAQACAIAIFEVKRQWR